MARRLLGEILLDMGFCTPSEIEEALQIQAKDGGKLGEILTKKKYANPEQIARALAEQFGLAYIDLNELVTNDAVSPDVIELVAKDVAVEHGIVPVKKTRRALIIAMADPLDFLTLDNLRFVVGQELDTCIASKDAIRAAIAQFYGEVADIDEAIAEITQSEIQFNMGDLENLETGGEDDEDAPVIRLVNQIIADAIKKRTSDIHVEPMEKKVRIRFRVDGACAEQDPLPKKLQGPVLSRLKIMGKMKPEEKRTPQDGRIKMHVAGREIDFRVNTLPAVHGESIVMRILDKENALVDLEILGLDPGDYETFNKIIKRPNGIFLVTGPTGSGKTTTLYAALKKLNRPDIKIITAENPVEYQLHGINQAQVNHQIGFDFKRILKAMLRQAPNVILVGEIRDRETAGIAIEAALTGHLVFSTLHTNDAPSAIARLVDMEVKPFLVASAVQAVLAQRLVKKLCPKCKEPDPEPNPILMRAVGLKAEQLGGRTIYRPGGCPDCDNKGYRGRLGCYELMEMNVNLRDLIFNEATTEEIRKAAIGFGMAALQVDGLRKVMAGVTTIDEILTITHRQDIGQD